MTEQTQKQVLTEVDITALQYNESEINNDIATTETPSIIGINDGDTDPSACDKIVNTDTLDVIHKQRSNVSDTTVSDKSPGFELQETPKDGSGKVTTCVNKIQEVKTNDVAGTNSKIAKSNIHIIEITRINTVEGGNENCTSNSTTLNAKSNVAGSSLNSQNKNKLIVPGKVIQNTLSSSLANLLIYSSDDSWDSDEEISEVMNKAALAIDDTSSDADTDVVEAASDSGESVSDDLSYAGCAKNKNPITEKGPVSYGDLQMGNLKPLPNISTLKIKEQDCIEMGKIAHVVDDTVMVDSFPNIPAYDIETLLFLDKGKRILGYVFDVIGPVSHPMYAIRFNSKAEIDAQNIAQGTLVYSVPNSKYTQYVFLQQLLQEKGTDASWTDDVEVPDEFAEFSDDEAEFHYKKAKQRGNDKRKRDSLERHQKFESEMNLRNVAESSRHVSSSDGHLKNGKYKNRKSGFKCPNSQVRLLPQHMLPQIPANNSMQFVPPLYGMAQCSNFPRQNSTSVNTQPYNYMIPELPVYSSQPPPIGMNFNPAVMSFPYLFTTPPPPPPENTNGQSISSNSSVQCLNLPEDIPQPSRFATSTDHQQHNKQRRKK